ncbi:MAG: DUF5640 domain-containing protein [Eubacteriales bacterium]
MKKIIGFAAIVMALAVLMTSFAGCMLLPKQQILGKWKDSTGIIGYEFFDDGTSEFSVMGVPVKGTYTMDTKAETITMTGTVLIKTISLTYKYQFKESSLILTDEKTGNSVTYIKDVPATTTK